jgi:hypothetical protein
MSHKSLDHRLPAQEIAQEAATLDLNGDTAAEQSIQEMLTRLRYLLEEGAVAEARALIHEAQQRWPDAPQVQRWARLLEPPQARIHKGTQRQQRSQEYAWLRDHAHAYPAQWLAVLGDTLIAVDADLARVLEISRKTGHAQEVLLHFQPAESWPH